MTAMPNFPSLSAASSQPPLQLNDFFVVQLPLVCADHLILPELPLEARLIVKDVVVDADHRVDRSDRVDQLGVVCIRHDDARQRTGHRHLAPDAVRNCDRIRTLRLLCGLLPAARERHQETENEPVQQ